MMKFANYSNAKVATIAIMVILSLLIFNTIANAQVFQMGNREYRFEDSNWFNYSSGARGDVIVPDRLIVRLASREKPVTSDFTNLDISGVNIIPRDLLADYYILEIDPNVDPFNVAQTLFQSALFKYVEFDALGSYAATPQDPYFPQQWNLDDTKLRMEPTWDLSTGDNSVILAIIDSGTEYYHEDLDNNIWNNSDELPGDGNGDGYPGVAGVDDDGDGLIDEDSQGSQPGEPGYTNDLFEDDDENGYIDDFHGWDFRYNDNTVDGTYYHGTAVAGIAGAQTHNYENGAYRGVAGIAGGWGTTPGASLMILRIHSGAGLDFFVSSTADCITYAAENEADVMNMSVGWHDFYDYYEDVVNEAVNDYDCVLVAASCNNDPSIAYPAKYANTIAVGATDENDVRRSTSNYGPELDVVAPSYVPTTTLNNDYMDEFSGTSASAPHVAGLAALIRSVNSDLTWDEVRSVIRNTADKVAGMGGQDFTEYYGYGRVNAHKALESMKSGTLVGDETWSNWVLVIGDVEVPRDKTLTIEAGTRVEFATACKLKISNGVLDAIGTENNEIVFTSSNSTPANGDWTGIEISGKLSNSSQIEYCQIEWAEKGISCINCSIDVSETVISDCNYGAYVAGDSLVKPKLYLSEVTCEDCSYGVRVQNGKARLWNCDFKDNSVGIGYFSALRYFPGGPSCQADIKNCDVTYNSSGIVLDDSSPIINYCDISHNSLWGLKCLDDSDPIIGENDLTNNGESSKTKNTPGDPKSPPQQHKGGLFCSGTSCPIVSDGPTWGQYERGWNVITDNISYGVYCGGQSSPKLGRGLFSDGRNSIYDNSVYDVYNSTGSTVWAEYNWWGDANGPDTAKIYGSVDWNPYLDEEPSKGKASGGSGRLALLGLLTRPKTREALGTKTKGQNPDSTGTAEEYNELGTYYLLQLMYDEAIEAFQYVLTNFPDCFEANYALVHLMHCYREGGYQVDIFPYLQNLSSISLNPELKNLALYMSVSQLCGDGQYGQALNRCQALLAAGCDEEMEKSLRLRGGMLYRYGLDDDEAAIAAFQDFITRYSEDPLTSIAQVELEILGVSQPPKAAPGAPATKPVVPLPESFALYQNYPNPFNARTCIEYELPQTAQVSLKIYNILGQQVKTLTHDHQPAGRYQVFWDGRDSMGIEVASGIYFVRLEGGTHALTRKMVLLR